ncbi:MAG: permease-like cell division protein FtsX, partial [Candidatus Aminicenantes bacterium]|nr:permease-like cell division protein FtsX [Candidatus Aminicenantes bacterium]
MNNLWQYRVRNVFSVTIICLSFLIVGIFLSLSNNLQYTAQQISKNMVIVFFLKKDLSEKDRNTIGEKLKKSSEVIKTQFISSEQALGKFLEKFPELQGIVNNLKINPFPPSFETTLKEKILSSDETQSFIQSMQNMKGIDDVQFNKDWVERMQSLSRLAKAVGFFLGGILILASFFIISNVIKLSVFARKD